MLLYNPDRRPHTPNPDHLSPPNSYQQFWNRSAAGMYRASLTGRFLEVNLAYAEALEYDSAVQLVGTVTCIAHEVYQSPTRWSELLTYLHQEQTIQGFESPVWTGKGGVKWVTECIRLVSDEQNGRYILEGVVHDITDRRRQALTREWDQLHQTKNEMR